MASYAYKGRARHQLVSGLLEGPTAEAVAGQLAQMGITPIEINEQVARPDVWLEFKKRYLQRSPELDDLILFSRQMYTLMRAGVPINQAMTGLIRSSRNIVLVDALREAQIDLESGRTISNAFSRHPHVFSSLFVNTVRVGENTGRLDEALQKISEYLELEKDTRARIKSALRYPTFVVIAMAIAIAIINIVVIPEFAKVFERANVALPLPTRVLIGTSNFFVAYWVWMLAGIVAAVLACRSWVKTVAGRLVWDRYKLRIPIIGDILYRATLGRFARSFSMTLSAGVPLIQALTVVSRAIDNEHIGGRIREMRTAIERGDSLTNSATQSEMFSPLVLQMLNVGEESGAIDELLSEVAGFYEREVDYDIRNLSQTIEPILIVFLAALVLVLALGVFLPMWDLATVKTGG
ncbi:MAG: type II secretion system F family protein [Pseudomonadota bacterium]